MPPTPPTCGHMRLKNPDAPHKNLQRPFSTTFPSPSAPNETPGLPAPSAPNETPGHFLARWHPTGTVTKIDSTISNHKVPDVDPWTILHTRPIKLSFALQIINSLAPSGFLLHTFLKMRFVQLLLPNPLNLQLRLLKQPPFLKVLPSRFLLFTLNHSLEQFSGLRWNQQTFQFCAHPASGSSCSSYL